MRVLRENRQYVVQSTFFKIQRLLLKEMRSRSNNVDDVIKKLLVFSDSYILSFRVKFRVKQLQIDLTMS